jgi:hypothetical protein
VFGAVVHHPDERMRFTCTDSGDDNGNNHGRKGDDCYCIRKTAKGVTASRSSPNSGPGGGVGIHLHRHNFGNRCSEQDNHNGKGRQAFATPAHPVSLLVS